MLQIEYYAWKKPLAITVSAVFFLYGLSLFAPPGVKEKVAQSDIVFAGKAMMCDAAINQLTFNVSHIWKGEKSFVQKIKVHACPYVELGKNYLVYAKQDAHQQLRLLDEVTSSPGGIIPLMPTTTHGDVASLGTSYYPQDEVQAASR